MQYLNLLQAELDRVSAALKARRFRVELRGDDNATTLRQMYSDRSKFYIAIFLLVHLQTVWHITYVFTLCLCITHTHGRSLMMTSTMMLPRIS